MVKNEEHTFKIFTKLLGTQEFLKVALLYGKEQFLVDWAYSEIVKKYVNSAAKDMDLIVFDYEKMDIDELIDAVETYPILSEKKVVVITGFTALKTKDAKSLNVEDEQKMLKLISNIPPESIFIILAKEVDKRKKLFKAIEEYGKAFDFTALAEKDLNAFINKHFAKYGKKIEMAAKAQLIQNSGYVNAASDYRLYTLENDIKKICAYSEADTVIAGDVLVFVSENLESNIFSMIDALARGNIDIAFSVLDFVIKNGAKENRNVEFGILALLASQFELMLKISELKEEGLSNKAAASSLGAHEYRVMKASEFAANYDKKGIAKALEFIYSIDRQVKEGTMEARLLLELFLPFPASLAIKKSRYM